MKRLLAARGTPAALVAVIALLAAGGGYALASGGGTIKACVTKGSNVLYTGHCAKGDKKLSWSKVGPQGKQGPQGFQGIQGAAGVQGPRGNTGPAGPVTLTHLVSSMLSCGGGADCAGVSPTCPSGTFPISGEAIDYAFGEYVVTSQEDSSTHTDWFVSLVNTTGSSANYQVGVICSSASSATGFSHTGAAVRGSAIH
jgi:hypothetical protein